MKLHPIVHDLKTVLWCGPGALATISGQPSSVCMQALRDSTWITTPIKGISCGLLAKAAARLGYQLTQIPTGDWCRPPTLAAWTRENAAAFADKPVIVNITGHFVVVKGRSFNDNHTKTPVSLKTAPNRRARVMQAFTVEPMTPDTTPPVAKAVKPVPVQPARDLNKLKAQRMASANGIPCGKDSEASDVIWVYAPPALDSEELDRYVGEGHACYDWADALDRVTNYVHDLHRAVCANPATLPEAPSGILINKWGGDRPISGVIDKAQ